MHETEVRTKIWTADIVDWWRNPRTEWRHTVHWVRVDVVRMTAPNGSAAYKEVLWDIRECVTQENGYRSVPEPGVQPKVRAADYIDWWRDPLTGWRDMVHWHCVDVVRITVPNATAPFKEEWVSETWGRAGTARIRIRKRGVNHTRSKQ